MNNDKPIAIVLGGTNPHRALLENLKNRGFYTILVDYNDNPPAKIAADEHIRESTLDSDTVLQIAANRNAKLVISTCVDQANVVACYISEKLGLPTPYSYETALTVSNKIKMKKIFSQSGIPSSKFMEISSHENIDISNFNYPLVVKPSDTTGSKGVKKASNIIEIKTYSENALKLSRTNTAIIEEFKEGIEIQIDCFVRDKQVYILMLSKKNKVNLLLQSELQSVGSIIPADISDNTYKTIVGIANKIVTAFGFDNTPFFIQTIVNGDEVNVIEFAPRIGGGLSYRIIHLYTGFDTLNHAVDFYTGDKNKIIIRKSNCYLSTNNIYTEKCTFGQITGYEKLLNEKIIAEFYPYKTKGMFIGPELSSNNRVGAFIAKASDMQTLKEKMNIAYKTLIVYDINGNNIKLKDFNI